MDNNDNSNLPTKPSQISEQQRRRQQQKNRKRVEESQESRGKRLSEVSQKLSSENDIQSLPKVHDPSWDQYLKEEEKEGEQVESFVKQFGDYVKKFNTSYRNLLSIERSEEKHLSLLHSKDLPELKESLMDMADEISRNFIVAIQPFENKLSPTIEALVEQGKQQENHYAKVHEANKKQLLHLRDIGQLTEEEYHLNLKKERENYLRKISDVRQIRDEAIQKERKRQGKLLAKANKDRIKFFKALLHSWREFTYRNWGSLSAIDHNLVKFFKFQVKAYKDSLDREGRERFRTLKDKIKNWKEWREYAHRQRDVSFNTFKLHSFWYRKLLMRFELLKNIFKAITFIPLTAAKYGAKLLIATGKLGMKLGKMVMETQAVQFILAKTQTVLSDLWAGTKAAYNRLGEIMWTGLRNLGTGLKDSLIEIKDTLKGFVNRMKPFFFTMAKIAMVVAGAVAAAAGLYAFIEGVRNSDASTIVGMIWDGVKNLIGSAFEFLGLGKKEEVAAYMDEWADKTWEATTQYLNDVWEGMKGMFNSMWEGMKGIFHDTVVGALSLVGIDTKKAEAIVNNIMEFTGKIWDNTIGFISRTLGNLWDLTGGWLLKQLGWFQSEEEKQETNQESYRELLSETIGKIWNDFMDLLGNNMKAVGTFIFNFLTGQDPGAGDYMSVGDMVQGMKDFFKNKWEGVKEYIMGKWEALGESIAETVSSIGTFFDGLVVGMKKKWNAMVDYIPGFGDSMKFDIKEEPKKAPVGEFSIPLAEPPEGTAPPTEQSLDLGLSQKVKEFAQGMSMDSTLQTLDDAKALVIDESLSLIQEVRDTAKDLVDNRDKVMENMSSTLSDGWTNMKNFALTSDLLNTESINSVKNTISENVQEGSKFISEAYDKGRAWLKSLFESEEPEAKSVAPDRENKINFEAYGSMVREFMDKVSSEDAWKRAVNNVMTTTTSAINNNNVSTNMTTTNVIQHVSPRAASGAHINPVLQ